MTLDTLAIEPDKKQSDAVRQPQMGTLVDAEIIRALTPLFIAAIGGVIGITVLFMHSSEAGFGLASTALAGAAGLAQPHKEAKQKDK